MKRSILMLMAFVALSAYATGDRDEKDKAAAATSTATATAESYATGVRGDVTGGEATAISEGSSATVGEVSGGDASTGDINVGGDSVSNETNFFAFSTTFPQASGCFGGAQGGGGGGSGGGFLGLHFLNNDCWTSALAEAEANVDIRARLKCGGKKFREAVAFDQPSRERQHWCVNYVSDIYTREIAHVKDQVEEAVANGAITEVTGDAFGTIMAQVSEEEFDEHSKETDEEIAEVRRKAEAAERRAREAEEKLREYEAQEQVKYSQLQQLQQQVREDYERAKPKEK